MLIPSFLFSILVTLHFLQGQVQQTGDGNYALNVACHNLDIHSIFITGSKIWNSIPNTSTLSPPNITGCPPQPSQI